MKKYEVLFRIEAAGFHEDEVAERVGELFDGSKLEPGNMMSFMWTRRRKDRGLMYESLVNVVNTANDRLEAAEKAGLLLDVDKMEPSMGISLVGARRVRSDVEKRMGGLIYKREKVAA